MTFSLPLRDMDAGDGERVIAITPDDGGGFYGAAQFTVPKKHLPQVARRLRELADAMEREA
ncbi:MAG: hypothetical protein JWM87_784 [Candidatus Eremiobacteraeota bacterium]|nr:hypothetical protein [Candidatus Eremiobacteraeota bacterium]